MADFVRIVDLAQVTPDQALSLVGATVFSDGPEGGFVEGAAGVSVAPIGDIDGDGLADVLIGTEALGAFVVLGRDGPFDPVPLNSDDAPGVQPVPNALRQADGFGRVVAGGGDVDGDGVGDYVVAAPLLDAVFQGPSAPRTLIDVGAASVVSGATGETLARISPTFPDVENDDAISVVENERFGAEVAIVGDLNDDGLADVAFARPTDSGGGPGEVAILFGSSTPFPAQSSANNFADLVVTGVGAFAEFGASVQAAGDVNGDGVDDLLVGAPGAGSNLITSVAGPGAAYVIYGRAEGLSGRLDVGDLTAETGFVLRGDAPGGVAGVATAGIGDVNGDGFDDIAVARVGRGAGLVSVVFGGADGPATAALGSLDGTDGFTVMSSAGLRPALAALGDVNGDGIDDFGIGDATAVGKNGAAGAAYVLYGRRTWTAEVDVASLTERTGFTILGADEDDRTGFAIAAAGDVDGDGRADIVVGSPGQDFGGGGAHIVFGGRAFTNSPPVDLTLTRSSVAENAPAGTVVGQLRTQDPDARETFTYEFFDSATQQASAFNADFALDASGRITINRPFDFEGGPNRSFEIRVTDSADNSYVEELTVAVRDVAEAPNGIGLTGGVVARDVATGSIAGVVRGGDDDANATLTYRLLDNAGGRFALDGETGRITVANGLAITNDDASTYTLRIRATDETGLSIDRDVMVSVAPAGTPTPRYPPVIDIGIADGSNALIAVGAGGASGALNADALGDVNGDGLGDFLVEALVSDGSQFGRETEAYIVYGRAGSPDPTVDAAALDGVNGTRIGLTADAAGNVNAAVSAVGDVNGDGLGDFAVRGVGSTTAASSVTVVYGREGGLGATLDVAAIGAAEGYTITGLPPEISSVTDIDGVGDINGDGFGDIALRDSLDVNAPGISASTQNLVVFGRAGGPAVRDFSVPNGTSATLFINVAGQTDGTIFAPPELTAIGDLDGDGFDDFGVAAVSGGTQIVYGSARFGATTDFSALRAAGRVSEIDLPVASAGSRNQIVTVGDLNGDGRDDVAIGVQGSANGNSFSNAGGVVVIYGSDERLPSALNLSSEARTAFEIDPQMGFAIEGVAIGDQTGSAVAGVGDLNGDGLDDLLIGAPRADPGGVENAGAAYVVFGREGGYDAPIKLADLDAAAGFVIAGASRGDGFGETVAGPGDVDGDGRPDLLVAAPFADLLGRIDADVLYTLFEGYPAGLFNRAPTALALSADTVAENAADGAVIGRLSATDPDAGETFTYRLADNANGRFAIVGQNLVVADGGLLDFEDDAAHGVRVVVTDSAGNTFVRAFSIGVTDVDETVPNRAPTALVLSRSTVAENAADGTVVGRLSARDPDAGETFTYRLTDDADGRFAIVGQNLVVADGGLLDFEDDAAHGVRVVVTDSAGNTFVRAFSIGVTDVDETEPNRAPTALALSRSTVAENAADGTVVGRLSARDPDEGETFTYRLTNDADGRFAIVGRNLVVADGGLLDFEDDAAHGVRVVVTDSAGNTFVRAFSIGVTDVDETEPNRAPTALSLSRSTVAENAADGTVVGQFTARDPDAGETFTYRLTDDADGRFAIVGRNLVVADGGLLDFEDDAAHGVRVVVTDSAGNTFVRAFSIGVTDVDETVPNRAPTALVLSRSTVAENAADGTVVGRLSARDPDAGETFTYRLTDDADGRFAIVGQNLVVADGGLLDFEDDAAHGVRVVVTDSAGNTFVRAFSIGVTDVDETEPNRAPTALALSRSTVAENAADGTVVGRLSARDPDEGETFTYRLTNDADGRFAIVGRNLVVADGGLLDFEDDAAHGVRVVVTDSAGATFARVFSIGVTDVEETPPNRAPIVRNDAATTTNDAAVIIDVLVNDRDPDGGSLDVTRATATNGTVTIERDDTLTFTPDADFTGEARLRYAVSDGDGGQAVGTVTVTVEEGRSGDVLRGTSDEDRLIGGDGDDTVLGIGDDDLLEGRAGRDSLEGGDGDDWLRGGDGDDIVDGGRDVDALFGGRGDDTLLGGDRGGDALFGEDGDDSLVGAEGEDLLTGGDGADVLRAGSGRDILFGGAGADRLQGGRGDDRLKGDGGDDIFVFETDGSRDVVVGFGRSQGDDDSLVFLDTDFADAADALNAARQRGGDIVFMIGEDTSIVLLDVGLGRLTADDIRLM